MLIFTIVFIVGILFFRFNLPTIKGKIGEKSVERALSFLPKNEYICLNDVMFKNGSYTTQIDHIVISVYGIFVIETKNYKGWIFGNANKDYWKQTLWRKNYSLYNPIFQNNKHISFLVRKFDFLRGKEQFIFPIVVFLGVSRLQLTGGCDCVIRLRELKSYIHSFAQKVMTIDECNCLASQLENSNIKDKNEREYHKNNVKAAIYSHKEKIRQGVCPLCGGRLILRNGRYGSFYGCSNYPTCKFTR